MAKNYGIATVRGSHDGLFLVHELLLAFGVSAHELSRTLICFLL